MCLCWCVTEINYKMHGAAIKIVYMYSALTLEKPVSLHKKNPVFFELSKDKQSLFTLRSTEKYKCTV